MSNESNDLSGAVSNLLDTIGKLGQQQIELLNNGIKTATQLIEPLSKTAIDLVGTLFSTFNQVLQNISAAISKK